MSFLKCNPSVFVIEDDFEVLVYAKENGIMWLTVGGEDYYEENSGVLSSEKPYAKIRFPQSALNNAKEYTVNYRKTIDRKAYFSEMGDLEQVTYKFKPLEKTEGINMYHTADVHYAFADGVKCSTFFGDDLDVLLVNGDIGEVETDQNYFEVAKYVGDIAKGEVPVIFVRGNHDTRGKLAEDFCKYFPSNNSKTYFKFNLGVLSGLALDCGEDKPDNHQEYGSGYNGELVYNGTNIFEKFRRIETEFLKKATLDDDKIKFVISHVCPLYPHPKPGSIFDIERELYAKWNVELERLNLDFMITGHLHKAFIINPEDSVAYHKHSYPIIVGSAADYSDMHGTAITINKDNYIVRFTNTKHEVNGEFTYPIKK
ncbi:MAG: metallophosphoesterase [Clostridia bacterium]|nr:metallophosphoesterase [Clostridia bacterium]